MNAQLKAKVRAVNRANEYAAKLYQEMVAIFRPLVGQKIAKKDGTLLARIEKLLPDLPFRQGSIRVTKHGVGLAWDVQTCESYDDTSCLYHQVCVYVGRTRDGVLTEIVPANERRSDFTAEEVEEKREIFRQAEQAMRDARSALDPFGENDY